MKQTNFIWKKKNWGVVKWPRFQKSDPCLILFTKILIRFFLSLKHPHTLTFFFTFFESFFSWQKNLRKKEQPKFLYETLYGYLFFFESFIDLLDERSSEKFSPKIVRKSNYKTKRKQFEKEWKSKKGKIWFGNCKVKYYFWYWEFFFAPPPPKKKKSGWNGVKNIFFPSKITPFQPLFYPFFFLGGGGQKKFPTFWREVKFFDPKFVCFSALCQQQL